MPAILLVEDEAIVARDLQESLLELGYEVVAIADSAEAALEQASRRRPDVVLMDIRIKGPLDGIQTARILKEEFHSAVIYLTAHADGDTIQQAKQTEPYGYLIKPVKTAELQATIETALYRRERDAARDQAARLNARISALTDLNLQLASERDPRVLLEKVCRRARTMFGAAFAVLAVNEKLTNSLFFCTAGLEHDAPAPRLDWGPLGTVCQRATAWRAVFEPHDPARSQVLPPGYPPARAYLAVPISSLSRTYGWLCLAGGPGSEQFTADDEHVLGILAGQVGRIYENGSLYQDLQTHAAKLQVEIDERKLAEEKIQHLNRVHAVLSGINGLIVRAQTQTELFNDSCRLAVE